MSAPHGLALSLKQAALVVSHVSRGRSLADEIAHAEAASGASRAALIDLTHGTLRRYGRAQHIIAALSRRPGPDPLLEALLSCSLYAIDSERHAAYTVVDQAVRACGLLEKWNAKGYVNAVLRGYLRERARLEASLQSSDVARFQHPAWWIDATRAAYPKQWEEILSASNSRPPMCLRVNVRRTTLEAYQERMLASGVPAHPVGGAALLLERPVPVDRLPGFQEGDVSVQDFAAQRAAASLDLRDGQRVLDACAAPGGKTGHLLELASVRVLALDKDPARCARIEQNLSRLNAVAEVRTGDCMQPATWWDGTAFDRILADVPCSGSGVVRRNPDIKWLRRREDIAAFATRQGAILDALWRVLAPDGKLLYVTCSFFPQENEEVVEAFRARTPGASRLPLPDAGPAQWLPDAVHDGFYCALIQKQR